MADETIKMKLNIENAYLVLKKYLEKTNHKKYEHSIEVSKTCKFLAEKWNVSVSDAIITGLLHDIGKSMSKQEMLSLCVRNNITIYDFELFENITALHGKISSLLFEEEFKGNDIERIKLISHAISSHVAGDINMNVLDKIIFIADSLESNKEKDKMIEQIKTDKKENPDYYIKKIIQEKIKRSKEKKWEHNPLLDATREEIER